MWNFKKIKYAWGILILVVLIGLLGPVALARAQAEPSTTTYQYLAPLPNQNETIDVSTTNNLSSYLDNMISIFIAICAVLAVIMIVIGGIQYMTSELMHGKEQGKERITNAVLGLLLALAAYAILYTINPDILNVNLKSLDTPEPTSMLSPKIAYAQNLPAQPTVCNAVDASGNCIIDKSYHLLAPLPDPDKPGSTYDTFDPTAVGGANDSGALTKYLNLMIKIFIAICAVLAVIMIVIGGIQYMTSELMHGKEQGKERITNAVLGLLLALLAWPLLNTINADTLNGDLTSLNQATLTIHQVRQASVYSGKGSQYCTPITDASSPCSVANLTPYFGAKATEASSICSAESGGQFDLPSTVDICTGIPAGFTSGDPFSWGLFQINIYAHQDEVKDCKGAFTKTGPGANDCIVADRSKYNACVDYFSVPANNLAFASQLFKSGGWSQWGANRSCHF